MPAEMNTEIVIRKLQDTAEAEICARMMVCTEPWIRLQRTFDETLMLITDPSREVYCATINGEIAGFIIIVMQGAFIGYIRRSVWSRIGEDVALEANSLSLLKNVFLANPLTFSYVSHLLISVRRVCTSDLAMKPLAN